MLTTFDEIETLAGHALVRKYDRPQIDKITDNATRIRGILAAQNVTPLAVIPSVTWDRICEKSGLRIFAPDCLGRVMVNTDDATYFITAGRVASTSFWLAPLAGLGWLTASHNPLAPIVTLALLFAAIAVSLIRTDRRSAFISVHRAFTLGLSRLYDLLPRQRLTDRMLRPGRHIGYTTLRMPPPPTEIASILARVNRVYPAPNVALQPGGYSLGKPSQVLRARLTGYVDERARQWHEWRVSNLDPIIFIRDGDMTAIIAQYGPFVIEREAVEQALAEEDCI